MHRLQEATRYTVAYVLDGADPEALYGFTLKPEIFRELRMVQDRLNRDRNRPRFQVFADFKIYG